MITLHCVVCENTFEPDFRYECREKDNGAKGICQQCEAPQQKNAIQDAFGVKVYKQIITKYIIKHANIRA